MLFLLRKIRRSFFLPGKVRTYCAYAFGEIVLIVVGILLALQISEWNQDRANEKLKQTYLVRLIANIESDLENFNNSIDLAMLRRGFVELLIEVAEDPSKAENRSAEFLVSIRHGARLYYPPMYNDTFEELRSTGHLLLLDDFTKKYLFQYYRLLDRNAVRMEKDYDIEVNFHLQATGVLKPEQEAWLNSHVEGLPMPDSNSSFAIKSTTISEVRQLNYDATLLSETVSRFLQNQGMIDRLPLILSAHNNLLNGLEGHNAFAKEVLQVLRDAQNE